MTLPRRLTITVLAISCVIALGLTGRLVAVASSPPTDNRTLDAQLAFLDDAIASGAPARMQEVFPEGAFFTHALTGLASANVGLQAAPADRARYLTRVDAALAALADPALARPFGTITELEHGIFYRGWTLLLRASRARLSGVTDPGLQDEADAVAAALASAPAGVPASYPGGYWPCDAVVAMAAVRDARSVAGRPTPELPRWLLVLNKLRDPESGLLPHRIDASGATLSGPQGSSQSLIQVFWPSLSPTSEGDWLTFRSRFLASEGGLIGFREYPHGTSGDSNVDSGPLVFGVSLSASAVGLGAARAMGETSLSADLDREAELLGLPWEWAGRRSFAFGALPVGDAFTVWARSIPVGPPPTWSEPEPPHAMWWPAILVGVAITLVTGTGGVLLARRR